MDSKLTRRNFIAASAIGAAVQVVEHLCEHSWHGCTQSAGRWGDGEGYCEVVVNGTSYWTEQGDRDCSSAVIPALA